MTDLDVWALAVDPQDSSILYAGTQATGVFKSTDGGATWNLANGGGVVGGFVFLGALAIDPVTPSTVYAAKSDGVFVTVNGAATWTPFNEGLTCLRIADLVIAPSDPLKLYAGTFGGGVFDSGPTSLIFFDGFESGDTSAWSNTVP